MLPFWKRFFLATRPWSFTMSFISVSVGTLLSAPLKDINWWWFLITLIGIISLHAAANIFNDYFDTKTGVDQEDSPTVKYRPHPIFAGLLTPRALIVEGFILLFTSAVIGVVAAWFRTPHILWIGLLGVLTSFFYTARPFHFKYRALGEVAVFLMWGPLMVEGAYAVQTGTIAIKPVIVSIPLGLLVALVLFANNMRDIQHDSRRQIKTLGILLGPEKCFFLFSVILVVTYMSTMLMIMAGVIGPWGLLTFLSVPKAVSLLKTFRKEMPDMADALTAQLDMAFGVLLLAAIFLEGIRWP
ncbi:MAG: 1,4-dihydroxy-2-naphthoate octaprenyltransferase [Syntrophales bacterium]|nr:1,4-dihydroxy-2-naphthoate octaprenyltransferase [Syntrophales bacterium]